MFACECRTCCSENCGLSQPTAREHSIAGGCGIEVYLPLADLVDPQQEKARLIKELTDTRAQIGRLETLLSSDFGSKAPPQVVEKERGRLAQFKETALKLEQQLSAMDQ